KSNLYPDQDREVHAEPDGKDSQARCEPRECQAHCDDKTGSRQTGYDPGKTPIQLRQHAKPPLPGLCKGIRGVGRGGDDLALDLMGDNQSWVSSMVNGEGCAAARAQRWMRALDRQLDVLRIIIASADDQEIVQTTGHKKLSVQDESQVAGSQEWPFGGIA